MAFVNFADQRVYRYPGEGEPQPITPAADVRIEVDSCSSIHVALPGTAGFRKADLSRESAKELEKVEK